MIETLFLFTDGCEIICYNIYQTFQDNFPLVKIGECKYRINIGQQSYILEVIGNNTIKLFIENNPSVSETTTLNLTEGSTDGDGNDSNLIGMCIDPDPATLGITSLSIADGVLTFKENGVNVDLGKYYVDDNSSSIIFYTNSNGTAIYKYNTSAKTIVLKRTCDCVYSQVS